MLQDPFTLKQGWLVCCWKLRVLYIFSWTLDSRKPAGLIQVKDRDGVAKINLIGAQ